MSLHTTPPPTVIPSDPLKDLEIPVPTALGPMDLEPLLPRRNSTAHVPLNQGGCPYKNSPTGRGDPVRAAVTSGAGRKLHPGRPLRHLFILFSPDFDGK